MVLGALGAYGTRCSVHGVWGQCTHSPVAKPSVALGAPVPPLHQLSQRPLQSIPCAQAQLPTPRSHSPPLQVKRVKRSRQERDIMDLKAQMAQVQELLVWQQTPAAPAAALALPVPTPVLGEKRVALEASVPPLSSSMSALMGCATTFLQVSWTTAAEPRQSVLHTQAVAQHHQPFPAFPIFMEEVRSSWDHPFLEGAGKLGLAGFPPVDSTIAALVKALPAVGLPKDPVCPNPHCRVTETHLKRAYAANTAGILTAYMDGMAYYGKPHSLSRWLLSYASFQASPRPEPGKPGGGSQTAMAVTGEGP
ncbi:UNVERIFIED_CONTAM: hypothetical protein FKN15_074356 [Acipenser sinensis]